MPDETLTNIPAIIALFVSVITALVQLWVGYRKSKVDEKVQDTSQFNATGLAMEKMSNVALDLLTPYKKEVTELLEKIEVYETKVDNCVENYKKLQSQYVDIENKNSILIVQNKQIRGRMEHLEQINMSLKLQLEKLIRDNESLSKKIQMLEEEREAMQKTIEYLSYERTRLEKELEKLKNT